jgi:hypothetical protein
MAESLSHDDRLRLIRELTAQKSEEGEEASILDLYGLGAEIWQGIDAQEHVRQERDSWGG